MKKYAFIILVSLFAVSNCYYCEDGACRAARIRAIHQINGTIEKKYIQHHNHAYRSLEIKQLDSSTYDLFFGERMREDFYEYVEVGDTIRKQVNSLTYLVIKPNGDTASFYLNFYCTDSLSLPQ